jgi:two-component system sporulation sensor kinase A
MKKIFEKIFIRNFKRIPYFFETKPKFYIEQNNYTLIGKLSTSLLHDILTPLTSLSLAAQTPAHSHTALKPIVENSTHQIKEYVDILKKFLTQDTLKSKTCINSEISNCLILLRHKAISHNIQIQYIEFDQISAHIHPLHIYQIVINLISNAIEASVESEIKKIIISVRKYKKDLYIECKDFGIGIPEDVLKKIGEYNFSTKSKERGFGIYSITYIVEHVLQGTLHIESDSQGSLFSCRIPLLE